MRLWSLGLLIVLVNNYQPSKQSFDCHSQNLEPLIEKMLNDLPSYANRVIQRSRPSERTVSWNSYVILAGKPDYTPLPIKTSQYQTSLPDQTKQVFFTTLEKQYSPQGFQERQNYYWLFLTYTLDGWKMVMLYTQLGSTIPNTPPSPPQETSQGIVGSAINLWLRDCQAGTIRNH